MPFDKEHLFGPLVDSPLEKISKDAETPKLGGHFKHLLPVGFFVAQDTVDPQNLPLLTLPPPNKSSKLRTPTRRATTVVPIEETTPEVAVRVPPPWFNTLYQTVTILPIPPITYHLSGEKFTVTYSHSNPSHQTSGY